MRIRNPALSASRLRPHQQVSCLQSAHQAHPIHRMPSHQVKVIRLSSFSCTSFRLSVSRAGFLSGYSAYAASDCFRLSVRYRILGKCIHITGFKPAFCRTDAHEAGRAIHGTNQSSFAFPFGFRSAYCKSTIEPLTCRQLSM